MGRHRSPLQRNTPLILTWRMSNQDYASSTPQRLRMEDKYYEAPQMPADATPEAWSNAQVPRKRGFGCWPLPIYSSKDSQFCTHTHRQGQRPCMISEKQITPTTLDAMLLDYAPIRVPRTIRKPPLLRLPRELRDIIYKHVLVTTTPLELAPFKDCVYSTRRSSGQWIESDQFHSSKWRNKNCKLTLFLRTCRQIYQEASPIYYAQPFRFSDEAGWIVLYYWLKAIGPRNRILVKDITVCHPAMATTGTCLEDHVRSRSIPIRLWDIFRGYVAEKWFGERDSLTQDLEIEKRWPGWAVIPHTAFMLSEMTGLRTLRLLIKRKYMYERYERARNFPSLMAHPIHTLLKHNLPRTRLTVVNLLRAYFPRDGEFDEQYSLENTFDTALDVHLTTNQDGRAFFNHIQNIGWEVTEMRYDINEHYPVASDVVCGNMEICEYLHRSKKPDHVRCYHDWWDEEDERHQEWEEQKQQQEEERKAAEHEAWRQEDYEREEEQPCWERMRSKRRTRRQRESRVKLRERRTTR